MADLDLFKNVNDSYGHIVGDFVLKSFVQFLQNNLRDGDVILARYGGEEFCIVMPGVQKEKAVGNPRADSKIAVGLPLPV